MHDLEKLKQKLSGLKPGLALDIDDTLSQTWAYWGQEMLRRFGNPEGLTWQEIRQRYRRCENVPYWQTEEAEAWMDSSRKGGAYYGGLACIQGAHETVSQIHKHTPIHLYLTARSIETLDVTYDWLARHGYPDAEVIARPLDVPYKDTYLWKAGVLKELYPSVLGIVDDDANLPAHLSDDYTGSIYVIGEERHVRDDARVRHCPTWEDVHQALRTKSEAES